MSYYEVDNYKFKENNTNAVKYLIRYGDVKSISAFNYWFTKIIFRFIGYLCLIISLPFLLFKTAFNFVYVCLDETSKFMFNKHDNKSNTTNT